MFVSRFKAVLSRLENLVASERAQDKGSSKRRREKKVTPDTGEGENTSSSLSSDHADEEEAEEPRLTKEKVDAASAADPGLGARRAAEPAEESKGPRTVGSFVGSPVRKPPSGAGSQRSRGTQRGDDEKANRRMLENLGKLETGHLRPRPIFPEVILGHLFMKKYGLSREQRSQVIRSTGGSCKFRDVEKVIRASDYEDKTQDLTSRGHHPRQGRTGNVMATEEADSSLSEPSDSESINEAAAEGTEDEDLDEDLEEAFEIQKKAKQEAKRAYRSYRDSRRKVKEIKKDRQPYMPVVAGSSGAPPEALPIQPTFKYDRKNKPKGSERGKGAKKGRREDVSSWSRSSPTWSRKSPRRSSRSLAVTVPAGQAVLDTGCTTSVVGEETAQRYAEYFRQRGLPEPCAVDTPSGTAEGLQWCQDIDVPRLEVDCEAGRHVGPGHDLHRGGPGSLPLVPESPAGHGGYDRPGKGNTHQQEARHLR